MKKEELLEKLYDELWSRVERGEYGDEKYPDVNDLLEIIVKIQSP